MRTKFVVSVEIPEGASVAEMQAYIDDAVAGWAGSLNPHDDPLFDLDRSKVKVTKLRKSPTAKIKPTPQPSSGEAIRQW